MCDLQSLVRDTTVRLKNLIYCMGVNTKFCNNYMYNHLQRDTKTEYAHVEKYKKKLTSYNELIIAL